MNKKIAILWLIAIMLFSFVVIIIEIAPVVKAPTIIYVDDMSGEGPGNPAENYTSIQDAINNANPGNTVFVYNGTYYENVEVNKIINLIGEDMNSTIIDGSYNGFVINVSSDWVNITGFTVTKSGNLPGPIGGAGILLNNVQNCRIFDNIVFKNINGITLYSSNNNTIASNDCNGNFDLGFYLISSWRNNVSNNNVSSNFDDGIRFKSSNENYIINNIISSNSLRGMFIEGSNKNNISGNTVFNNNVGIYLYYSNESKMSGNNVSYNNAGFVIYYSNMNNITNNNASNNDQSGIGLYSSIGNILNKNIMIEDSLNIEGDLIEHWNTHEIDTSNMVNNNPIYYLKNQTNGVVPQNAGEVILANCSNITIIDQEISNGTVGILLGFSSNNTIIRNNISFNKLDGIYISHSVDNSLLNNNFSSNKRNGIYVKYSTENNITTNNVSWNKIVGIHLQDSQKNKIYKNNIYNNFQMNIYLYWSSNNNTISHNTISYYGTGIAFWRSSNNSIIYNNILNTFYSISLSSSSNNDTFHHNNFVNNQNQIYLEASCSDIVWDDGYEEGNFWSDYFGIDDGSDGRIAGDGVGDTEIPHPFIDQSNGYYQLDNYPLMNTVGNYIVLYEGWNLISIPLIQDDENLASVLASIDGLYDAVQWCDITDPNDPWKHHKVGKPFGNNLFKINETMGIWIHTIPPGDTVFYYNGTLPTISQSISLLPGWNLVGYPSLTSYNRTEGLNNITFGQDVDSIWTYNADTQKWIEIGESDYFEIGKGYWIHSKVQKTWEVPI